MKIIGLDGEELIEKLKKDRIPDGATIEVINVFDKVECELQYINGEICWQPGAFKMSMLYNFEYTFNIIEPNDIGINSIKKIRVDGLDRMQEPSTGAYIYGLTPKEKVIVNKINEVVDYINENNL